MDILPLELWFFTFFSAFYFTFILLSIHPPESARTSGYSASVGLLKKKEMFYLLGNV